MRRWVGRTLHELKQSLPPEWVETAMQVRQLLQDLPIEGDKRLLAMVRRLPPSPRGRKGSTYTPLDQLRGLILRLIENWSRFRVFDWDKDVPWTNNPAEQVIGRMKMRARTVRGYKSWPGMASGLLTSGGKVQ